MNKRTPQQIFDDPNLTLSNKKILILNALQDKLQETRLGSFEAAADLTLKASWEGSYTTLLLFTTGQWMLLAVENDDLTLTSYFFLDTYYEQMREWGLVSDEEDGYLAKIQTLRSQEYFEQNKAKELATLRQLMAKYPEELTPQGEENADTQ